MPDVPKRSTSTSSFGVGKRESHDASEFYARFTPPELSDDDTVVRPEDLELDDPFIVGSSADMHHLPDNCVALVVTSPPYFVGKDYELADSHDDVPKSYDEFKAMLRGVFAECHRVLEPGGRIAVNVANLGRKPYISLSGDIIGILDELGYLLRGEVIWQKAEGSTGSCAWGTFRSPANPTLRDITERVVIASKGRFDRVPNQKQRMAAGLPHVVSASSDEFMEATLDVWKIDAESAKRVGHPAPFPVALPERLIHLYTYENDLILDPFMGSGSTLVAAAKTARRYVGYDLDESFVDIARERVAAVVARKQRYVEQAPRTKSRRAPVDQSPADVDGENEDFQARASREGKAMLALAEQRLDEAGFQSISRNVRLKGLGVTINLIAQDDDERDWYFDVSGAFTTTRGGLLRTDTVWKCLGRAHLLTNNGYGPKPTEKGPVVFLTSHLPKPNSDGDRALRKATTEAFFDAIELFSDSGFERLQAYATGGHTVPLPGFWTEKDLD